MTTRRIMENGGRKNLLLFIFFLFVPERGGRDVCAEPVRRANRRAFPPLPQARSIAREMRRGMRDELVGSSPTTGLFLSRATATATAINSRQRDTQVSRSRALSQSTSRGPRGMDLAVHSCSPSSAYFNALLNIYLQFSSIFP